MLLATTSTAFYAPSSRTTTYLNNNRGDRFFSTGRGGEDEELERLRRENAQLRSRLDKEEGSGPLGLLRGLFGKREETALERQKRELDSQIDEAFRGTGLLGSLAGAMTKSVMGMASSMMAQTNADIDLVQKKVAEELERQGKLQGPITSDTPMQQSYASTNINGRVTKNISLVYRVSGSQLSGTVRVQASVRETGDVEVTELNFNDRPAGGGSERPFTKNSLREGTVIDV